MIPPVASKFVAGETPAEAVEHAAALNDRGVKAILNLLGEHYAERPPADEDAAAYENLVRDIESSGVDACISVKPSQIGLDVGEDVFAENLAGIVAVADEHDVFTWVDMEDHETTDATLDAYEELTTEYGGGVGVCVQANLKRTEGDLERLAGLPGKVRLVKGAYDEPKSLAYKRKERVNEAYREDLEYMFREFDGGVAVGSHDPEMISLARDLHDEYGTDYEVQMLMGVRDDAQVDLAADGVEVYQYVPYGGKWFSYFYRRAMERKENLLFALRAVLGR
ncbi:proline dehydrogenase family protein [Halobacterium sp. CBA1126]|uniref:proline dehydrogenase family protein n=1 Tax=Halobacterium TaxID=2239 RepID=UPI0012FB10F6|nr:proline dehydrogenase family protein [Halobacterium sp. CBA1126]MUV59565.1 proline dehydrogenase [Halobacterium sp. CBA1126]